MENLLPQAKVFLENFLSSFLGFSFTPSLFQAAIIVVSVFLLALTLGLARHHMVMWSVKGANFGFLLGIIFILVIEAVVLLGGRTALFEGTKGSSLPPQLQALLRDGRESLIQVLGLSVEEIPVGEARQASPQTVLEDFQSLDSSEAEVVRSAICKP